MYHLRRLTILALSLGVLVVLAGFLPRVLNPVPPSREQRDIDKRWINTSPYWLDRQSCRWLSLCGILHVRSDPPARLGEGGGVNDSGELRRLELRSWEHDDNSRRWEVADLSGQKSKTTANGQTLKGIPDYVLKYAPLVHLYSGESFWPSDIADHIQHMSPFANDIALNATNFMTLQALHGLDSEAGSGPIYLRSNDDVESRPEWLHSNANKPVPFPDDDESNQPPTWGESGQSQLGDSTTWHEVDRDHPLKRISDPRGRVDDRLEGESKKSRIGPMRRPFNGERRSVPSTPQHKPDDFGYSKAPATLVLVDKGSGIVDAFWFFFYAYNLGQTVMGIRFGNHVGDWEHCMIRFESGIPRAVFFSEHEGGQAYAWNAVEKRGNDPRTQRPVIYSAVGSHAMYAFPGDHAYVLPFNMLKDQTDRGPLWDAAKNFRAYWYDYTATGDAEGLEPVRENPNAPTDWFHYNGTWGDKVYGLNDRRQWRLFGQYHYVTGPEGPKAKNLGRERVCQLWRCKILHSIDEGRKSSWHS